MGDHGLPRVWRFAEAELNARLRELRIRGQLVELAPKPFDVLVLLLEKAGELLTADEILEAVWTGRVVNDGTIASAISKIRKALGDDDQSIILTVAKVGYRLVSEVKQIANTDPRPVGADLTCGSAIQGRPQWRLLEHLGSGGYGDAWLAQHEKTQKRRVFKFARSGERLLALKREVTLYRYLQQALGDRDDFVAILEWNFDEAPYFTEADYAGENLQRWFVSNGGADGIPLDQRIAIAIKVADSVAAAHSVGVLHKDLKPENVLIASADGKCCVRLCDFGVGHLIDPSRLGEFCITRLGMSSTIATDPSTSGTLLYMAPELLSGGAPSLQSDIYALGILLFQLIIGEFGKPMPHGWQDSISDELLRQDVADATHGDRERRFASARMLADHLRSLPERRRELERQREELARTAQASAVAERARIRRPWLIAAMLILSAAVILLTYSWLRIRTEARVAEAFDTFITSDILHGDSNYGWDPPALTLKSAIIHALPEVSKRFADDSRVEASLEPTLANALYRLSDWADALPLHQRAAQIDREKFGPYDSRTLRVQIDVSDDLWQLDRQDEAVKILASTNATIKEHLSAADQTALYGRLEDLRFNCGSYNCEQAVAKYQQVTSDMRAANVDDLLLRTAELGYGRSLLMNNRLPEADRYLTELIPGLQKQYGDSSLETLWFRNLYGQVLRREHRLPQAESEFTTILPTMTALLGEEGDAPIDTEMALAAVYKGEGRWKDALPLLNKIYAYRSRVENVEQAKITYGSLIAEAKNALGDYSSALTVAQESAEIARGRGATSRLFYYAARRIEAEVLLNLGRWQEASTIVKEVIPMTDEVHAGGLENQWRLLYLRANLAKGQGHYDQARDLAKQALTMLQDAWGADDCATRKVKALLDSIPASPSR